MWCSRLDFVVLCVWVYVGFSCADRRAKIDQDKFKSQGSSGGTKSSPTHFIYPRTGRLFHADFVRDNEIFKSLERTNFMRRGPLAQTVLKERQRRTQEGNEGVKKYVYVGEGRVPVPSKKSISAKERDNPINAVLFKVSKVVVRDTVLAKRAKRDVEVEAEPSSLGASIPPGINTNSLKNDTDGSEKEEITSETENKVDCDNISSTKNNDTDKTLFVHDSISRDHVHQPPSVKTTEVEVDGGGLMKKTVVDDSLKLYPVYRGVKYYCPQTERRLVYSPQLTVHMDVPLVTEAETEEEANSTAGTGAELTTEEGRSRRPFKKLAFPLLLALKLKTAIMVPLILGLIGLISFKGLWSGLTALAIAAALGLKALVAGGGAKVLVHALPPPPPPTHVHHLPPPAVEYAEYWSRRNDDHHNTYSYSDYRPSSWS